MMDFIWEHLLKLLALPGALPVLALLLLLVGVPISRRSRRPRLYSALVISVAGVVLSIWLLPPAFFLWLPLPLAIVLLVFGLPEAGTFRRPERFRGGIIAIAAALIGFSLLPALSPTMEGLVPPELEAPLVVIGLLVLLFILAGGVTAIKQANNTPNDHFWDSI